MSIQCFPDPETDSRAPYMGPPLRVSYHMHEYSGGEHYNSIVEANEIGKPTRGFRKRDKDSAAKENSDDKEEGNSATACVSDSDSDNESDDSSSSAASKKPASSKDDDESWDPQSFRNGKKPRPGKGKASTATPKEPAASTPSNVDDDSDTQDAAAGRHKFRHPVDDSSKGMGKKDSENGKSNASAHPKDPSKLKAFESAKEMLQRFRNGKDIDKIRVPVWDPSTRKLLLGNAAPLAKGVEEYLLRRTNMRIWDGVSNFIIGGRMQCGPTVKVTQT
jgi:hypothetical protein